MEYKDKIYFLEDILDEFEKQGGDKEAAEAIYWYFLDKTLQEMSKTDNVVFKIPKFGNLYYTISSLHGLKKKVERELKYTKKKEPKTIAEIENVLYIVNTKLDKVDALVQKALDNKVKNIWFFRKRFNPKSIKNG